MKLSIAAVFSLLSSLALATVPFAMHKSSSRAFHLPSTTSVQLNLTATSRMSSETAVCDVFHISYRDVQQAYVSIQSFHTEKEQCEQLCEQMHYSLSEVCSNYCAQVVVENYNTLLTSAGVGAVTVATMMLDVEDSVEFQCLPYLKDSTVGNCYVHEYVWLNKGSAPSGTFDVEQSTTEHGEHVQCRANALANQPQHPNQSSCRDGFSTTAARIIAVDQFMMINLTPANMKYSLCLNSIPSYVDPFVNANLLVQCASSYEYDIASVYIQCASHYNSHDCDIHAALMGHGTLGCSAHSFRRESMVEQCSVLDVIDLWRMDQIEIRADGLRPLIADACSY